MVGKEQDSCCTGTRFLVVIVVVVTCISLALLVVLLYREISGRITEVNEPVSREYTSINMRQKYPGFFRNTTEQDIYQDLVFSTLENGGRVVNDTFEQPFTNCMFFCRAKQSLRKKRSQLKDIYHGCCKSSASFITFDTKKNVRKTLRTVVQFDTSKQYFLEHTCKKSSDCTGCTCKQSNNLITAVVLKTGVITPTRISHTELDTFFIDGCCRCVNK